MSLDINKMSLDEIYKHVQSGLIDVSTFADYVNSLLALGVAIGKKQAITLIQDSLDN